MEKKRIDVAELLVLFISRGYVKREDDLGGERYTLCKCGVICEIRLPTPVTFRFHSPRHVPIPSDKNIVLRYEGVK